MRRVQLLKAVQRHHCLFAHKLLGVGAQLGDGRQNGVDEVGANQLAYRSQCSAYCSVKI